MNFRGPIKFSSHYQDVVIHIYTEYYSKPNRLGKYSLFQVEICIIGVFFLTKFYCLCQQNLILAWLRGFVMEVVYGNLQMSLNVNPRHLQKHVPQ